MIYTTTLNKASQATVPKAVYTSIGINPGERFVYNINEKTGVVTIEREKTLSENLNEAREKLPEEVKERIRKNAGKTVSELREIKSELDELYYYKYTPAYYYEQNPDLKRTPEIEREIEKHQKLLDKVEAEYRQKGIPFNREQYEAN